jgi:hypothetical protein
VSANIGESAGDGKSLAAMSTIRPRPHCAHRRTTDFNVVEDLISVWRNDELLNAVGTVCQGTRSVPGPFALSADRQLAEHLPRWRLDCEPDAARDKEFAWKRLSDEALHGIVRSVGSLAGRRARVLSMVASGRPEGASRTSNRASAKAAAPTSGRNVQILQPASGGALATGAVGWGEAEPMLNDLVALAVLGDRRAEAAGDRSCWKQPAMTAGGAWFTLSRPSPTQHPTAFAGRPASGSPDSRT